MKAESFLPVPEEISITPEPELNEVALELEHLKTSADAVVSPEKLSLFEAAKKRAERFAYRTMQLSLIGALASGFNYKMTHPQVETNLGPRPGMEHYEHPDSETTHILDFISGKDTLTSKEQEDTMREMLREGARLYPDTKLPDGFEAMDMSQLGAWFLDELMKPRSTDEYPIDAHRIWREMFEQATLQYEYDEKLYSRVWEMEKEVGSPKVRWIEEGSLKRAHYNPPTNTIYISRRYSYEPLQQLIAEASHAKQFNDNQIGSYTRAIERFVLVGQRLVFEEHDSNRAYQHEYETPGTIEHEAHKVIEPYLLEKYDGLSQKQKPHKGLAEDR